MVVNAAGRVFIDKARAVLAAVDDLARVGAAVVDPDDAPPVVSR